MPLAPGDRFGAYEVIALLGTGGMGEVYRARDGKLGREVAIKVLPAAFMQDPERRSRFDREAQLLASLNHPHIGAIYGLEHADGTPGIVLELVDGHTLAERIAGKPLPIDEALAVARQIAEALEAAHERGIVHRDLKPANVKITSGEVVKVLDFGLAKTVAAGHTNRGSSDVETRGFDGTEAGVILGTPAYMSPEQARGLGVDKRTDIWAFGCVLYEMLTGVAAFGAATMSDTIAAILGREPNWDALPAATPAPVRRVIERCLAKDSRHRLRDMGDALLDLERPIEIGDRLEARATPARRRALLPWAIAALLACALVATMLVDRARVSEPGSASERLTFTIAPPRGVMWGSSPNDPMPAASPDGRLVAFAGTADDGYRLWVHDVRSGHARSLEGTQDASRPAWSPDSRALVYCADGRLKTFDISGRAPSEIAAPGCRSGVSWSGSGELLYAVGGDGLWRVSSRGGQPQRVTTLDRSQETMHMYPVWLSDDRHFIYLARSAHAERRGIYLGSLDGAPATRLVPDETAAAYAVGPAGRDRLLFVRGATLVSQVLNARTWSLEGDPMVLGERVAIGGTVRNGAFAASPHLLVFRSGGGYPEMRLSWVDRQGRTSSVVEAAGTFGQHSLSSDGSSVASERYNLDNNRMELWLTDVPRGVSRRLLAMPYGVGSPVWAPDGNRLAFLSTETGSFVPFELTLTGATRPLLTTPGFVSFITDWSPDGRWILGLEDGYLVAVPADASGDPIRLAQGGLEGRLSPNGRWVAYRSSESGKPEIYVQRFPDGSQKVRVSADGGVKPSWRADGAELFYRNAGDGLMVVDVRDGVRLEIGTPRLLFRAAFSPGATSIPYFDYAVSKDGQRFLIQTSTQQQTVPLTAIVNWMAAVEDPKQ